MKVRPLICLAEYLPGDENQKPPTFHDINYAPLNGLVLYYSNS